MVHVVSTCTWRNGKHEGEWTRFSTLQHRLCLPLIHANPTFAIFFLLLPPPSPLPPLFFYVFVYSFPFHPPLCTSFLSGNIWRWRSMNGRKRLFLPPCDLTSSLGYSRFFNLSLSFFFSLLSSREDTNRDESRSSVFRWWCKIFHRTNRNRKKQSV